MSLFIARNMLSVSKMFEVIQNKAYKYIEDLTLRYLLVLISFKTWNSLLLQAGGSPKPSLLQGLLDTIGGSVGKESACNAGDHLQCRIPGFNPWVEKIPWRRKWQPTPVLLPEKSHGQRSLRGYSPWGGGHKSQTRLSD